MIDTDDLESALSAFLSDPPDTEFQRGYLACLIDLSENTEDIDKVDPGVLRRAKTVLIETSRKARSH